MEKNCDEIYCAPTASKCYGIGKKGKKNILMTNTYKYNDQGNAVVNEYVFNRD